MNWIGKYVGVPFLDSGRTLKGCDCWGLLWIIFRDEFCIGLPSLDGSYTSVMDHEAVKRIVELLQHEWEEVDPPSAGDVMMATVAGTTHVGLCIGGGRVLHTLPYRDSCIERIDRLLACRITGYFRREPSTDRISTLAAFARPDSSIR